LIRRSRLADAERILTRVLDDHPNDPTALARMGDLRAAQRRHSEAETYYRQAVKYGVNDANVYYNLGLISFQRGDLEEARQFTATALQLQPNHAGAATVLRRIEAKQNVQPNQ